MTHMCSVRDKCMCLGECVGNALRTQVSLHPRQAEHPLYRQCDCLLQCSLPFLRVPEMFHTVSLVFLNRFEN